MVIANLPSASDFWFVVGVKTSVEYKRRYCCRGVFDRQDSVRSEYTSDRESTRYGIVQQASIDSTDSRICYLTSSEVSSI